MDNRFETSFIPQQPLLRVEGLGRRQEYINFALVVSLVLFFVTVAVAGGLYFYERQIRNEIRDQAKKLESLENEIGAASIDSFRTLDSRIALARMLLDDHKAFSSVLDFIENNVARDIGLTGMGYRIDPETKNIILNLRGEGADYASVYRQEDHWRKLEGTIAKFDHKRVKLNETSGVVEFEVDISLDASQVLYKDHIPSSEEIASGRTGGNNTETAAPVVPEEVGTPTAVSEEETPVPVKKK